MTWCVSVNARRKKEEAGKGHSGLWHFFSQVIITCAGALFSLKWPSICLLMGRHKCIPYFACAYSFCFFLLNWPSLDAWVCSPSCRFSPHSWHEVSEWVGEWVSERASERAKGRLGAWLMTRVNSSLISKLCGPWGSFSILFICFLLFYVMCVPRLNNLFRKIND